MSLHKNLMNSGFKLPECEKHFHDHDETWIVLAGRSKAFEFDREGKKYEYELEAGDVWMIEVGHEHGSMEGSPDFKIAVFYGTMPPGCHKPGHYYMEKERYTPSFELEKTPTDRYSLDAKQELGKDKE